MLISKDVTDDCVMNCGLLVMRNDKNYIGLLTKIYDLVEEAGTRFKHNWEQDAFILYYTKYMTNPNEIVLTDHGVLQSFYRNYTFDVET